MGKLIDADALKERIRRFLSIKSLDDLLPEEKAIVQHIDRMPPVDAVPVVRCRDCRFHGYNTYTKVHYCRRPNVVLVIKKNDFCKYGKRNDGKVNGNEAD